MGKNVVFLPECHSTNVEASRMADHEKIDGTIVITSNQTAGRGQRGSSWITEPGKNLTFSIILKPRFLSVQEQFCLNRAMTLGIADYARSVVAGKPTRIKWPNDVLIDGEKICGVLIENTVSGNVINQSIVGIGLNVNQKSFVSPMASSLANFAHVDFDLEEEFGRLLAFLEARYLSLKTGDRGSLKEEYLNNLYWRDEWRSFKAGDIAFEGRILGDNDEGRLQIETAIGVRSFGVKEVEYLS